MLTMAPSPKRFLTLLTKALASGLSSVLMKLAMVTMPSDSSRVRPGM